MKRYGTAIQCTDTVTGKTGSYFYDLAKGSSEAASPVFSSLMELYEYRIKHRDLFRELTGQISSTGVYESLSGVYEASDVLPRS